MGWEPNIVGNQIFALLWVFGWAAFFLILKYLNGKRQQRKLELINRERLAAMEKGIPLPELPDYDQTSRTRLKDNLNSYLKINPRWPLGAGAIFIMLGAGVSLALRLSGEDYHRRVWPFGLIGIFFGIGLLFHYFLMRGAPD